MARKIIQVEKTCTGSDGTGHHRGTDGKYYYGNLQNGYLTKTLEQQRRDAEAAEAQAQEAQRQADIQAQIEEGHARRLEEARSPEALQRLANISFSASVGLGAFLVPVFYVALCLLALASLLTAWPGLVGDLFHTYAAGEAGISTILQTVNGALIVALFLRSLPAARAGGKCVWQFAVLAVVLTAAFYTAAEIVDGSFYLFNIVLHIFYGLYLASLPTFILYYMEYRSCGGQQFLREIAARLCELVPGHSALFRFTGCVICGLAILMGLGMFFGNTPIQSLPAIVVMLLSGIFALYTAKAGDM